MQHFIESTIQALRNGTANPRTLAGDLRQLGEQLEAVEAQYETAPEEEEELRLALLQAVRHYQLSLDLLGRYLENPEPELLERAQEAAVEATLQLDDLAPDA
ncbi:hypothetical protein ABS71_14560 [bacterium SCN 62-11]|nr:MAG: hypothetical protein ABS71_14560 [bacterium SCN 62-11]